MELTIHGRIMGDAAASRIVVRDGRVVSVEPGGRSRAIVLPPLFDIQVNGHSGINLQAPGLKAEHVAELTARLARQGVAYWAPTLITNAVPAMARACRVIAAALRDPALARAIPGIHLEGPFISPADGPRGAHPPQHVILPSVRVLDRLMKAADGKILYITLAPEMPGAEALIRHARALGIAVSLGHHQADAEAVARAADAGARLCTHLGNGIAAHIPRHHNPLWPQLAEDRLAASLLADLHHLPPPVLKSFIRAKGAANVILASDCVHIAGLQPGPYELGGQDVELLPTGRICLKGTELLAGSSLMLLQGVFHAVRAGGMSLEEAVASATTVPARILGVRRSFARPAPGRRAHFIVVNPAANDSPPSLGAIFIHGQCVTPP